MNSKKPASHFDKLLNILLLVVVLVWLTDRFIITKPALEPDHASPSASMNALAAAPPVSMPAPYEALTMTQLEGRIAQTQQKPVLLLIYTSWCPFCKQLLPRIINLAEKYPDQFDVLAISTDQDKNAIQSYMNSLRPEAPFPVYLQQDGTEKAMLKQFMQKHGLQYRGGIPYMAFFLYGEAIGGFSGALPKEELEQIIEELKLYRHQQENKKT